MQKKNLNNRRRFAFVGVQALACLSVCAAAPDVLVADFEADSYSPWQVVGEAFGAKPAAGTLPNQMPVTGFRGRQLVNSYYGGDKSTGTLTSAEFKIQRPYINFLIGGGNHPNQTCINLLVDGRGVRTTTGPDSEHLDWATWDVRDLDGKSATIQVVDSHTGGWGHISIDHIQQSAERMEEEVVTNKLYAETWRPQFHFTAEKNWLNDPNGLVFYEGQYHLFFQHNPEGINWGNMTWGHAVSRDLIHWKQRPHALERDKLGTMFSGSAVVDWNNTSGFGSSSQPPLIAIYTAAGGTSPESKGQRFTQCIAYSTDKGHTWNKYDGNPVLKHIAAENRDPKVIWHEQSKKWIMTLYLEGNRFAFFSSPELKTWTHLHNIDVPGCDECPDFFPMRVEGKDETKWVWTAANGNYLVGSFDGQNFSQETGPHRADWGKNFYAVQTYSDIPESDGRRIQVGWMRGAKYPRMPFNQQMSFPCELKLRSLPEGLRLTRLPVKEINLLHTNDQNWTDQTLPAGENLFNGVTGELLDLRIEIDLSQASHIALKIRGEPINYSLTERRLSCLGQSAPLDPVSNRLKFQILVDRTSIEVFANDGRISMSSCFLPKQNDKSLELKVAGGPAKVIEAQLLYLRSAWD